MALPVSQTHLQQHREQCKALVAERQALLQQQANVLRGYIMAGHPLPTSQRGADARNLPAAEQREVLLAQLTQEEAASRAALEALKQGCSLAKAREIGGKVLRQGLELSAGAAAASDGPLPAAWSGPAQPQRSVLLAAPQEDSAREASPAAAAAGVPARASTVQFAAAAAAAADNEAAASSSMGQALQHGPTGNMDLGLQQSPAAGCTPALLQSVRGSKGSQDMSGFCSPWPEVPWTAAAPDYIVELKQQVAALQSAMEQQLKPLAAAATASNPWSQLLPAVTAAAVMAANPAAAATVLTAGQQQQQQLGFGGFPGLYAGGPWPGGMAGPGGVHGSVTTDPELAAAASAHAHDMVLLRMEVERAKGVAELEQIRCQLAALQQAAGTGGGPRQLTGISVLPAVQPFAAVGQAQLQADADELVAVDSAAADDTSDGGGSLQHKLPDTDAWLDPLPSSAKAAEGQHNSGMIDVAEDEGLSIEEGSAVLAARGSNADTDVLQVSISTAGPFSKKGTYRVAVVLYEGFQPVEGGPGQLVAASTSKRLVTPPGTTAAAGTAVADGSADTTTGSPADPHQQGTARFNEALSIKGVKLSSTTQVVFELYMAKPGLAGLPTKELLVGWTMVPLMQNGQVLPGLQSLPLFRLPLMLTAQRKFTFDNALLEFKLTRFRGAPGDIELPAATAGSGRAGGAAGPAGATLEDIPGVPTDAWVRVQRGVPPADPYTPGDGLVVVVDGARFLPANVTISKVLGSVWSSNGQLLAGPFEGVAQPESDALNPAYFCTAALGVAHNSTRFEDPTATLMLQVQTIERFSRSLRVVGFALLAVFLDPKAGGQPVSRSIQDYVLNQGAFQIPLHAGAPCTSGPLRYSSLDATPRLPCASLLMRILTPEMAKLQRRKAPPHYGDRVYDTVSRCLPSSLEKNLYCKVLGRRVLAVREAARLVAWFRKQRGGLSGRRVSSAHRHLAGGAEAPVAAHAGAAGNGGFLSKVFGVGRDGDAAAAAAASAAAHLNTGDPSASIEELQADLEQAKAEQLPPSDPEIMDWMSDVMLEAESAALAPSAASSNSGKQSQQSPVGLSFINYNTAYEYCEDLGFFVALDGACRLNRMLPSAGLISYSPPGSLYQDHPVVDDLKATLDYDLDAPLAGPRWLDGYQQFADVPYSSGLVVVLDIRFVVPGSCSSAPAGWACLPVFERAGRFVASGTYHLPLFQGVPSQQLLSELAARQDPDAVMSAAIASGRVRPSLEASSVLVRLMCGSRQGQLEIPAWNLPLQELRVPRYAVMSDLGPRFLVEMRKMIKNKTYSQAKPKALTDDQWVDQINDTLIKVAGLDEMMGPSEPGSPPPEQQLTVQQSGLAAAGTSGHLRSARASMASQQQQQQQQQYPGAWQRVPAGADGAERRGRVTPHEQQQEQQQLRLRPSEAAASIDQMHVAAPRSPAAPASVTAEHVDMLLPHAAGASGVKPVIFSTDGGGSMAAAAAVHPDSRPGSNVQPGFQEGLPLVAARQQLRAVGGRVNGDTPRSQPGSSAAATSRQH